MNTALLAFGAIVLLLAMSAFFAGSETALTAVSRGKMLQLEKEGSRRGRQRQPPDRRARAHDRRAAAGQHLRQHPGFVACHQRCSKPISAAAPFAIATAIMTVVILVFAEVLPKTLAIARTDRFALTVALARAMAASPFVAPIVNAVQFVVWKVLGCSASSKDEGDPMVARRTRKFAAPSNCITRKAAWSANIAT